MKVKIRLDTQQDAARLSAIASGVDGSVTITDDNGLRVNAKSVIGVLYSLEFTNLWLESDKDIYRLIEWAVL